MCWLGGGGVCVGWGDGGPGDSKSCATRLKGCCCAAWGVSKN